MPVITRSRYRFDTPRELAARLRLFPGACNAADASATTRPRRLASRAARPARGVAAGVGDDDRAARSRAAPAIVESQSYDGGAARAARRGASAIRRRTHAARL